MRYFLIIASLLINIELLKPACFSSSRIAAVVNKGVITQTDLQNRLRFAAISSGLEPTPKNLEQMHPQMLRVMIDEQLQLQLGKEFGIEIDKDQVQEAIRDIEDSNGMPDGAIANILKKNNIPFETFANQIKAQIIWLLYIREKYPLKTLEDQIGKKHPQGMMPSLQIADWEIDQELKRHNEKNEKTQYHLAEILLPFDSPNQEETVKNDLKKMIKELENGANFQALAQQFSQSPTSSQGGDMGWLTEDQLDPEIKEALSKITPGQLSPPIRTPYGYAIIAYIERKGPASEGQILLTVKQILLPFPKDITDYEAQEIMEKAESISKRAKNCSSLEKLAKSEFSSAMSQVVSNSPLVNFSEPLQKILDPLSPNQAIAPLLTPDGGLLLMVCEKKKQEKEVMTREGAKALIVSRKHTLLGKRELRDLRRHAFIDIRR